jgi:hypothetical protein
MNVEDLCGRYYLDAVDFSEESVADIYGDGFDDCSICRFRLDSIAYIATEDPDDGYRSHMKEIKECDASTMTNVFPAIEVVGYHRVKGCWGDSDDVVEFIDVNTGKVVLEIGTVGTDDYYPCYVASFHPEAMHTNK